MSFVNINGKNHYYERIGTGPPIILIHGAFVDSDLWNPQVVELSSKYQIVRYDLRGHGRTGPSDSKTYSIDGFADDLAEIINQLQIEKPIICGISLGGMIAQAFAVRPSIDLKSLILADTAVSVDLTFSDKLQTYLLFPKWAMKFTIRAMSARKFTEFSFWLAQRTRSSEWFGRDEGTANYVRDRMLQLSDSEYEKIYDAIYEFRLQPLERIKVPTLVMNGEFESKAVFRHTEEILRRIPNSESVLVPEAGHTSNMENPKVFNQLLKQFLIRSA